MSRIYKGQKKGRRGEEESLVWEDWDYSGLIKVSLSGTSFSLQSRKLLWKTYCQHQMSPNEASRANKGSSANQKLTNKNLVISKFSFFTLNHFVDILLSSFRLTTQADG